MYKLFNYEFNPLFFTGKAGLNTSNLSVSTADMSDLPSTPESAKKNKSPKKSKSPSSKKAKSPSPRKGKSPSPTKKAEKASPKKSPKAISPKAASPKRSPKAIKRKSPTKASPVLKKSPPKVEPALVDSDEDYEDEDFEGSGDVQGAGAMDDVFLNHSSVMEESYGEEDFEDDFAEEEELKNLSKDVEERKKKKEQEQEQVEEGEEEEDDDYGDEDDFDDYDPEDDKPKSCLKDPSKPKVGMKRNVKFLGRLVTSVNTRPKTLAEDVKGLFYTEEEITNFEDAAYIEEQRGMEPGSLDDRLPLNALGAGQAVGVASGAGAGLGGQVEIEDEDALETFEDYDDDDFDKGGFGSDDEF